ncbi:hypothetical protein [Psychromonas sp.]|uniref:hypothetical protein n=1 Tax=Psychromonas sp. TaxID=1884585 RepID=UPI003561507F
MNCANGLLLRKYEPENLLKIFLGMQFIGGVVLVGSMLIRADNLWIVVFAFTLCPLQLPVF